MATFLIVKNNIVENAIECGDQVQANTIAESLGAVAVNTALTTPGAWIGWTYDGTNFSAPAAPELPEPVQMQPSTKITRLAFRNRFTSPEKVAIYDLAKTNTLIAIFLDDINAAKLQCNC